MDAGGRRRSHWKNGSGRHEGRNCLLAERQNEVTKFVKIEIRGVLRRVGMAGEFVRNDYLLPPSKNRSDYLLHWMVLISPLWPVLLCILLPTCSLINFLPQFLTSCHQHNTPFTYISSTVLTTTTCNREILPINFSISRELNYLAPSSPSLSSLYN